MNGVTKMIYPLLSNRPSCTTVGLIVALVIMISRQYILLKMIGNNPDKYR